MSAHPFGPNAASGNPERRHHRAGVPPQLARESLEVLVVDDDPIARVGLARAIRSFGHACRMASSGEDALRVMAEGHTDVVISDWEMPGMSGAELCKRTRSAADEAPYTYFVFLTGFDDREHLLAGMAAGADDYQRKPVDLDELEARLMTAARVVELHRRLASRTEELRHDSKRFYQASRTDPLTGAGNRLHLDQEVASLLSRAQRYGHRCSLAICDVDMFKAFNDRFGHVAGDEALRRMAEAMRVNLRASDTLFRYGGEEFVVLLVEQPLDEAACAMERLRARVERIALPSPAGGGSLTVSIGVAEVDPSRDHSAADWLVRADAALYLAKARGRNCVVSTPRQDA